MKLVPGLCALAVGLTLAACGSTPPAHLYALQGGEAPAMQATLPFRIVRVDIPDLVDRPQLVIDLGAQQVQLSEEHRWADSLRRDIAATLQAELARRLAALPGERDGKAARIRIDVRQFASSFHDGASETVAWHIERSGLPNIDEVRSYHRPGPADYTALVAAHRAILGDLAGDIATRLAQP